MPALFSASRLGGQVGSVGPDEILYSQGDPAETVLYVESGEVTLSLTSSSSAETMLGILHGRDFCGEGALAGQPVRATTATTAAASRIRVIPKDQMNLTAPPGPRVRRYFIGYMLKRNRRSKTIWSIRCSIRPSNGWPERCCCFPGTRQRRTARGLCCIPSRRKMLAEMVGTTRSRVNLFMNRFRKDGLINYDAHGLTVHRRALREVVRRENPAADR